MKPVKKKIEGGVGRVMSQVLDIIKKDPNVMLREYFAQQIQMHRQEIRYHERKITECKKEIQSLAPPKTLLEESEAGNE